jgi:uncharacterized membrane protein YtjA (UPF0391 family)
VEGIMLRYASVYLFIALVAALFGISAMAVGAHDFAAVLFLIFVTLFIGSIVGTLLERRNDLALDAIDDAYPGRDDPGAVTPRE